MLRLISLPQRIITMKTPHTSAALSAALLVHSTMARVTPPDNGYVLACKGQGCDNCPVATSINEGYPQCLIYNSADSLGQDFAGKSGMGYDVWWDSGAPNAGCEIIVRTPASTDLPACGYYERGWKQAGCYYTAVQDSFMLQYCCGTGDCEAAAPAASVADAHYQMMHGNTSAVSLKVGNLVGESGKRSIEDFGDISWKRSDHHVAKDTLEERAKCTFHPTSGRTTEGGRQVKASGTNVCNNPGGCSIRVDASVTEGETISPSLTANLFDVISAAVGYTFMKSTTYTVSTTYNQAQGTTG